MWHQTYWNLFDVTYLDSGHFLSVVCSVSWHQRSSGRSQTQPLRPSTCPPYWIQAQLLHRCTQLIWQAKHCQPGWFVKIPSTIFNWVGVRCLTDLEVRVVPGCHTTDILSDEWWNYWLWQFVNQQEIYSFFCQQLWMIL